MDTINQKEYLKKYLGIGKVLGEKKKKKKLKGVANRIKIIDDDVETTFASNIMEEDPLLASEDAPQIVAIIDERPPSLRVDDKTKNPLWQPIGTTETLNATEQKQMISGFKIATKANDKSFARPVDRSPPRKRKAVVDGYSPSRKSIGGELSPSRKRTENDSSSRYEIEDNFSLQKSKDYSPSRRSKSENNSPNESRNDDYSPPRKCKDDDISPPRKRRNDSSPPRKSRSENSSPRKPKSDDYSLPRKQKTNDISLPRKSRKDDNSPPRKSRSENSSPRKARNDDYSPPRKSKNYDTSPPRKPRSEDNSPPRRSKDSGKYSKNDFSAARKSRSDISSPKKNKIRDYSSSRKQGKNESENKEDSKKNRHSNDSQRTGKMEKTLDGKAAGLQNAEQLVEETKQFRNHEEQLFKNLSQDVSGENAETVFRDRKSGKIRNLAEEEERQRKKRDEEEKNKEKYSRWGRGLVQVENRNQKIQDELYEMSKPLARYADDEDLEKFLKEQEREGDPMLAYIRSKKRKEAAKAGVVEKPEFEGQFMPNRYGIKPGHRWDGVDRSNGYEKRWFEVQNAKRAQQEDVYKWSTEDM